MDREKQPNKIISITVAIFYLLLQFQLGYVLDFPVTISLLGLPLFVLTFVKFKLTNLHAVLMSAFVILSVINQIFSNKISNEIQFIRTFILILSSIFILGFVINGELKLQNKKILDYMLFALLALALISISQAILGYKYGAYVTNPFGKFSYQYQYSADLNSTITRASGLYSEPSFNALVCISFVPLVFSINKTRKRFLYIAAVLVYMTSTFSLIGILTLGFTLFISIFSDKKRFVLTLILFFSFLVFSWPYISARLSTLNVTGSSANFRIVAPLNVIFDVLPKNLFGIPLGTLEDTIGKYGFLNGDKVGTSVDNGFLLLIIYFGMFGIVFIAAILFFSLKNAIKMRDLGFKGWPTAFLPLLALNFNGGIFLPDFLCIISFMLLSLRFQMQSGLSEGKTYEAR